MKFFADLASDNNITALKQNIFSRQYKIIIQILKWITTTLSGTEERTSLHRVSGKHFYKRKLQKKRRHSWVNSSLPQFIFFRFYMFSSNREILFTSVMPPAESQNLLDWKVPLDIAQSRVSWSSLARPMSSWVLSISTDRLHITHLGNLFQCLTIPTIKSFFLNFSFAFPLLIGKLISVISQDSSALLEMLQKYTEYLYQCLGMFITT